MIGLVISGPAEWVLLIASLTGGVVTIVGVVNRWLVAPLARSVEAKIEQHLEPVLDEIRVIRGEVSYNHGTSLKDKVRDVGVDLAHVKGQIDTLTTMIGER
jgi:hypothetical protein